VLASLSCFSLEVCWPYVLLSGTVIGQMRVLRPLILHDSLGSRSASSAPLKENKKGVQTVPI
jgi:hypothetical protein